MKAVVSPRRTLIDSSLPIVALLLLVASGRAQTGDYETPRIEPMPKLPEIPRIQPTHINFPPHPRPLDQKINPLGGGLRRPPGATAFALEDFVNEPFYPQLAFRLNKKTLSRSLSTALGEYLAEKERLRQAIRDELRRTEAAPPVEREQALQKLALAQAPALAALRKRTQVLWDKLTSSDEEWGALREWRLGDAKRGDRPAEVSQVMLAAAFYEEGLEIEQRELLRAIALEVTASVDPIAAAKVAETQPFFHMLPAPARIALPINLPPDVGRRAAELESRLSAMRKELYDWVFTQDRRWSLNRRSAFAELAKKQVPEMLEIDRQAEALRRDLIRHPDLAAPPKDAPLLPAAINQEMRELIRLRMALEQEIGQKILQLEQKHKHVEISYAFAVKRLITSVRVTLDWSRHTQRRELQAAVGEDLEKVQVLYRERFDALAVLGEAIGPRAVAHFATPSEAAVALAAVSRQLVLQAKGDPHEDYRAAVLEPGLSLAQRRLLFDAAAANQKLPPPRSVLQPERRAK